jgi:hypothetical protein
VRNPEALVIEGYANPDGSGVGNWSGAHHISREPTNPYMDQYGDGLGDSFACTCGLTFGEVQYDGFMEAIEHLEAVARALS